MEEEQELAQVGDAGIATLFYVLDIGDELAAPLAGVFNPKVANILGHVVSFAINSTLWVGLVAAGAAAVRKVNGA